MNSTLRLLAFHSDTHLLPRLRQALQPHHDHLDIHHVTHPGAFETALAQTPVDLIVADADTPRFDGYHVLSLCSALAPHTPCILLTRDPTQVANLHRAGAADAFSPDDLSRLAIHARPRTAATPRDLERRARGLQVLAAFSSLALRASSRAELLDYLLRHVGDAYQRPLILLIERTSLRAGLRIWGGRGWSHDPAGTLLYAEGDSLSEFTLENGQPVICEDIRTETRFQPCPILRDHHVAAALCVPIEGFGALGLYTLDPTHISPDEIEYVRSITGLLSQALQRLDAQHALSRSRAHQTLILSHVSDAVFLTDADHRLTYWSPAVRDLFERDDTSLPHCTSHDLLGPDAFDPAALDPTGELRNLPRTLDHTSPPKHVLVHVKRVSIDDGVYLFSCRDVTDAHLTERALDDSLLQLQHTLATLGAGLWEWDLLDNSIHWSPELYALHGLDPQRSPITYESSFEAVHPDDRDAVSHKVQAALSDPRNDTFQLEYRTARDRYQRCHCRIIRDRQHTPTRLVGVTLDVTETHNLQLHLSRTQRLESLGQLAGGIAHDFNNMLSVIEGYAHLALNHLDDPQRAHGALESIRTAAERSSTLTRQLLAFGRQQTLRPQTQPLAPLLDELAALLPRVLGDDIELDIRCEAPLDPVVVDGNQLHQALVNLAINARHAMPRGGTLRIHAAPRALDRHDSLPPGDYASIRVSDTGHGMPPDVLARAFDPFFTTKAPDIGTGLGLASVHGFVLQSEGAITVDSTPQLGTTFTILLPTHPAKPTPSTPTPKPQLPRGRETLLVVEDEPLLADLLRESLEDAGYTVVLAPSPEDALETLAAPTPHLDLLFTDLIMPRISGRELAQRAAQLRPGLPVIYASGYARDSPMIRDALPQHATFLPKPIARRALLETLRSVLDTRDRP